MIGQLLLLSDDELLTIFFYFPKEYIFNTLPYICKRFFKIFKNTNPWIGNYYLKNFANQNEIVLSSNVNWLKLCARGSKKLGNYLKGCSTNSTSFGFQKTLQKTTKKLKLYTDLSTQTEYIITGHEGGKIEVWSKTFNSTKWEEESSLKCHFNEITCLEMKDVLVSGSKDYDICIFDNQFEKMLHKLEKHEDWVKDVKFVENQKQIVSISRDKSLILWDYSLGDYIIRSKDFKSIPWTLESNSFIYVGDTSGNLGVWSLKGEQMNMIKAHNDLISGIKLNGNDLYTSSYDRFLKLWDIRKLKDPINSVEAHDAPIYSIDFETSLISSSIEGTVRSWDKNLKPRLTYLNPNQVLKTDDEDDFKLPTRREVGCKVLKGRIFSNNDPNQSVTLWDETYSTPQTSFIINKKESLICFDIDINKLVTSTILNGKPKLNVFYF